MSLPAERGTQFAKPRRSSPTQEHGSIRAAPALIRRETDMTNSVQNGFIPEMPDPSEATSAWRELGASCEEAIDLSQLVGKRLAGNASAGEVVGLLERQLKVATSIRDHVAWISETLGATRSEGFGSPTVAPAVAGRLRALISLEDCNRQLLSKTGMALCRPRVRGGGGKPA